MKFGNVRVIALKEFRDVLRDRRTLIFMMLLPVAVMPLLMFGGAKFVAKQKQEKMERQIVLAADPVTRNTLVALGKRWVAEHPREWRAWQLMQALSKEGAPEAVERAGEVAGSAVELAGEVAESAGEVLGGLADRLGFDTDPDPAADGAVDDGAATDAAVASEAASTETDAADPDAGAAPPPSPSRDALVADGALDARSVDRLLSLTEFVRPGELTSTASLQDGLSIPDETPEALRSERLAVGLQEKEIHAAVALPADSLSRFDDPGDQLVLPILYDSSQSMSEEAEGRLADFIDVINRSQLASRLDVAGLDARFAEPARMQHVNLATRSRKLQAALGGFLPYLLLAFCFFGALYPALDVTAGEKERFTLETVLLAPITRFEIACGKFFVVFTAAIVAALLSTASMVVTLTYLAESLLPPGTLDSFDIRFQPLALVLTGSLILPVAAMYAAALLAIGVYARSFKEAQSYTVPLQFLFVLPTMVALMPDVETKSSLAWIPFVNISLLVRELLKGNYLWEFYGITLASTLLLTVASLWIASRLFRRESVLLRV